MLQMHHSIVNRMKIFCCDGWWWLCVHWFDREGAQATELLWFGSFNLMTDESSTFNQ